MNGEEAIVALGKIAEKKFGLTVGENPHFGGVDPVHVKGSNHYAALAIDVTGPTKQLAAFNRFMAQNFGDQLAELFYDPGISIKHGQRIGSIGGHGSHVHVATESGGLDLPTDYGGGIGGFLKEFFLGDPLEALDIGSGDDLKAKIKGPAADAAGDLATKVVEQLFALLGEEGARVSLYIALVGGGASLVLYGISKVAGVSESETELLGGAGKVAAAVATKGAVK